MAKNRWDARALNVVRGAVFADTHGEVRVMAVVDDCVVARRSGCVPFLEHIGDFLERFKPMDCACVHCHKPHDRKLCAECFIAGHRGVTCDQYCRTG